MKPQNLPSALRDQDSKVYSLQLPFKPEPEKIAAQQAAAGAGALPPGLPPPPNFGGAPPPLPPSGPAPPPQFNPVCSPQHEWLQVPLFLHSLVSFAIAILVTDKENIVAVADAMHKVGIRIASTLVVYVDNIRYRIVS